MRVVTGWVGVGLSVAVVTGCRPLKFQTSRDSISIEDLDLGQIPLGLTASGALAVLAAGEVDLSLTSLSLPKDAPGGLVVPIAPPLTVGAGATTLLPVRFTPTSAGTVDIPIQLVFDPGGPAVAHVRATVVEVDLTVDPARLDFGAVSLRSTSAQTLHVHNGSALPLVAPVAFEGAATFGSPDLPPSRRLLIPAGGEASFTVAFTPVTMGVAAGAISLAACAGCAPIAVPLTGEGVGSVVSVVPPSLDFGDVRLAASRTRTVTVSNAGNQPLALPTLAIVGGSPAFTVAPEGPIAVPPGGSATLSVTFAPRRAGADQATLQIATADPNSPLVAVPLTGTGGGPSLAVLPSALDFGAQPRGTSVTLQLLVENAGDSGAGVTPLAISSLAISGGAGELSVAGQPPPALAAGQSFQIAVTFAPTALGLERALLAIVSNDPDAPVVSVPLFGSGRDPLPCQIAIDPVDLDFGLVNPGQAITLGFALENAGADVCFVTGLGISPSGSQAYSLPNGPVPEIALQPGDGYDVLVHYAPAIEGEDLGAVVFGVSNPAAPIGRLPLIGSARKGCLTISPSDLDFGPAGVACPPLAAKVTLENSCPGPISLDGASVGGLNGSEFSLSAAPWPVTLSAGGTLALSVAFSPSASDPNEDPDSAELLIDDGEGRPRTVGLFGVGLQSPNRTDGFTQGPAPKVDVLLVIDNSGSFEAQQQAMHDNAAAFLSAALAAGVDFHLGVTSTGIEPATGSWATCPGGANGGEAGRLFPVDDSSPRILTPATPGLIGLLANDVEVGVCHWDEQAFQAAVDALTPPLSTSAKAPGTPFPDDGNLGFLRPDALLNIIFIQDDDDESQIPVDHFSGILRELKGAGNEWRVTASAVTAVQGCNDPSDLGVRYFQLVKELGGTVESVCTTDWGGLLGRLAARAFSPRLRFPLSGTPSDASQISVTVGGQSIPPSGPGASTWTYDAATNELVFDPSDPPPAGAQLAVTYPTPCP